MYDVHRTMLWSHNIQVHTVTHRRIIHHTSYIYTFQRLVYLLPVCYCMTGFEQQIYHSV